MYMQIGEHRPVASPCLATVCSKSASSRQHATSIRGSMVALVLRPMWSSVHARPEVHKCCRFCPPCLGRGRIKLAQTFEKPPPSTTCHIAHSPRVSCTHPSLASTALLPSARLLCGTMGGAAVQMQDLVSWVAGASAQSRVVEGQY